MQIQRMRDRTFRRVVVCFLLAIVAVVSGEIAGNFKDFASNPKRYESYTSRYTNPPSSLSLSEKVPFSFGYRFTDDDGTLQTREEKTDPDGAKTGWYSFVDPTGTYRRVDYVADHQGFRATVTTNEPGAVSSVHPANVHVRIGNPQPSLRTSPQMDFSSPVLSRYNHTVALQDQELQKLDLHDHILPDLRYQGQSLDVSDRDFVLAPLKSLRIRNINDPNDDSVKKPSGLVQPEEIPTRFLNSPNIYEIGEKFHQILSDGAFPLTNKRPNSVRYARRLRDSKARTKQKRHFYKIHTPRGYENLPNLPLYRDK